MQNITKLISVLCLVAVAACGSSGGGGGGGNPLQCMEMGGSSTTCKASDWDDYNSCLQTKCGTEYSDCYGSGWASGNLSGGKCSAVGKCYSGCKCGDRACDTKCGLMADADCQTCAMSAESCAESSGCTKPACASASSGSTGSTSGSHTCADLKACCDKQSGTQQTECQALYNGVQAMGDSECSSAYSELGAAFQITCP